MLAFKVVAAVLHSRLVQRAEAEALQQAPFAVVHNHDQVIGLFLAVYSGDHAQLHFGGI